MANIEQFAQAMEQLCKDDSHGYSQINRWGSDYDCSSAIIHALQVAGFDTGTASYTGNLSAELTARGWVRLPASMAKQRGDILLNDVNHVAVYLGNNQLAEFSISENGTIDGQAGDQTGREAYIPVSYTHLDVYKRQDLYLQEGDNEILATDGFEISIIPNWRVL